MKLFPFFLLLSFGLYAQNDTLLRSYSPDDVESSLITDATPIKGEKTGMLKYIAFGYNALVVDSLGDILHQTPLLEVLGYEILVSTYIHDATDHYIVLMSGRKDDQYYFLSVAYDTTLSNPYLVDTLHLEYNELISFESIKYNPYKACYEGFGALRNATAAGSPVYGTCYLAMNPNLEFTRFNRIIGPNMNDFMLEFYWNNPMERYYVSSFGRRAIVIDDEMNLLESDGKLGFTYDYNNITYTTAFKAIGCAETADGNPICCGTQLFGNDPYSTALIKLNILSDTVEVDSVYPLNIIAPGLRYSTQMRVDSSGYLVIAGCNSQTYGASPNQLNIVKLNPVTYQKVWSYTLDNGYSYNPWEMEIDKHNNIIVVGRANLNNDSTLHGFMLKVWPDGISSTFDTYPLEDNGPLVMLYPNPTQARLCLKSDDPSARLLRIWTASGTLVMEHLPSGTCVEFAKQIPSGVYTAEIQLGNGRIVKRRFIVN